MDKEGIVTIFARCFRKLAKLNSSTKDKFFYNICSQESEELLRDYSEFLKLEGEPKRNGNNHVAQSKRKLIFRIRNILNILEIIKHLKLSNEVATLLLERDLHLLRLKILNLENKSRALSVKTPKKTSAPVLKLSNDHNEIVGFIRSNGQTQNLEVFDKFQNVSKRTLKRKLSELIGTGVIQRISQGKKVFYLARID